MPFCAMTIEQRTWCVLGRDEIETTIRIPVLNRWELVFAYKRTNRNGLREYNLVNIEDCAWKELR